jgi:cytochrome o ubiquinol oxidase subunit 2
MRIPTRFTLLRLLPLLAALFLSGCSGVLDPKGQIGIQEKSLIITATVLMLLVVVPVIIMTLVFAWKYRASNTQAVYTPNWSHSTKIEVVVWTIPVIIVAILAVITLRSTYALDPYKPLDHAARPIEIEAVSLDWKWLFIYPELGIATVNEIHFPKDVPVNFRITSDTVMNAFFIPQLGSQVYSMAGMQTKLHLIANEAGTFDGLSSNYSGEGFSDMKFTATASSQADFDNWVKQVRQSPNKLNLDDYKKLALPSEKQPAQYFSTVDPELFHAILNKYMTGSAHFGSQNSQEMGMQMHSTSHEEKGSDVNRGKPGEKGVPIQPNSDPNENAHRDHDGPSDAPMKQMDMSGGKHSDQSSMHGGMVMSTTTHSGV